MMIAAALAAASVNPSLVVPQPVRYEFVYETAKRACPASYEVVRQKGDMTAFFNEVSDRLVLSPHEKVLLLDFCLLYDEGLLAK